jgi:FMN phosphatase YigB (HAD superfamily)
VATRLRARRIGAEQILMIGCDQASDLLPARRFGWRTWQIAASDPRRTGEGPWPDVTRAYDLQPMIEQARISDTCTT